MLVATERCMEYIALSIGCRARLAFLIGLGVTARFTARPGCMARRTLRGTSSLEKKPTLTSPSRTTTYDALSTPADYRPLASGFPCPGQWANERAPSGWARGALCVVQLAFVVRIVPDLGSVGEHARQ